MDRKLIFINKMILCFLLLGMGSSLSLWAQNCANYDTQCKSTDTSFTKSSQSAGLKIQRGQKLLILYTVYAETENYISVCGDPGLGQLNFKIIDYNTLNILYDNADNSYRSFLSLKVKLTVKIAIEISAPTANFPVNVNKCVGLLIMYKDLKD